VLTSLLGPPVAVAEVRYDPPEASLLPAEESVIARAVEKRRKEFTTARWCARNALASLGLPPAPVLPGPRGAPQWPVGVVGSITHCVGYRAAALARARDIAGVGIDAEPNEPLPGGVTNIVALPHERARLADLTRRQPQVCWDRLLFSTKESVYKAWFPLTHRWLDFTDVQVTVDVAAGTFRARLRVPVPNGMPANGFSGRWLVADGLILTALTVPRPVADEDLPRHPAPRS
jgi:4'-phosphopantetheinyl transferase EntD